MCGTSIARPIWTITFAGRSSSRSRGWETRSGFTTRASRRRPATTLSSACIGSGRRSTEDHIVFERPDDPEVVYDVDQSSDHRFLAITAFKGASEKCSVTILKEGVVHWSISGFEHGWHFLDAISDDLLLRTNLDAPRSRIVAVSANGAIRTIVAEAQDSLVDASLVGGRLAAIYLHNASSRVRIFEADGGSVGDLVLPAIGSVSEMRGEPDGDELFLRFASFTWPPSVLRAHTRDLTVQVFAGPGTQVDPRAVRHRTGLVPVAGWHARLDVPGAPAGPRARRPAARLAHGVRRLQHQRRA